MILPSLPGSFFLRFSSPSPQGAVNSVIWLFYAGWTALGDSGVRERDRRLAAHLGVKFNLLLRTQRQWVIPCTWNDGERVSDSPRLSVSL